MQTNEWIELFRLIPESRHNALVLTTMSGVDLSIDTIIRTEPSLLVFRGRVCGQTDDGRLFFLPYRQIDFVQLNRSLMESEINEILAGSTDGAIGGSIAAPPESEMSVPVKFPSFSGTEIVAHPNNASAVTGEVASAPAAAHRPQAPVPVAGAAATPRNNILERLRAQRNAILPQRPPTR